MHLYILTESKAGAYMPRLISFTPEFGPGGKDLKPAPKHWRRSPFLFYDGLDTVLDQLRNIFCGFLIVEIGGGPLPGRST